MNLLQMTVFVFLSFGYLLDVMFYNDLDFLFDPNADVSHTFWALLNIICISELEKKDGSTELSWDRRCTISWQMDLLETVSC